MGDELTFAKKCPACNDTGALTREDGEWMGYCPYDSCRAASGIVVDVDRLTDDDVIDAAAGSVGASTVYGPAEAWSEGKTLTILFHRTGQLAKFRFVKLHDGPTAADLRGEPE